MSYYSVDDLVGVRAVQHVHSPPSESMLGAWLRVSDGVGAEPRKLGV